MVIIIIIQLLWQHAMLQIMPHVNCNNIRAYSCAGNKWFRLSQAMIRKYSYIFFSLPLSLSVTYLVESFLNSEDSFVSMSVHVHIHVQMHWKERMLSWHVSTKTSKPTSKYVFGGRKRATWVRPKNLRELNNLSNLRKVLLQLILRGRKVDVCDCTTHKKVAG